MQIDAWERGFSDSYDAPLDMRMDPRQGFSAADLVNEWPESRITQVLRRFGEERHAGGIAREIVARRPLRTTSELVAATKAGMPASARFGAGHPAKKTFQALRIAVNGELELLERGAAAGLGLAAARRPPRDDRLPLAGGPTGEAVPRRQGDRLRLPAGAPGLRLRPRARGRAAHPPGDRAGPAEVEANPRSRSAHLRAAAKIAFDTRITDARAPGRTADGDRRSRAPLGPADRARAFAQRAAGAEEAPARPSPPGRPGRSAATAGRRPGAAET